MWAGCAASGNVLKSEIHRDKVKFSEIKWNICKPIFYGGIPWCCDKKIPSCFESQRQCRLFKVSSFNILHQCTIPNYSLNCQIWKKEKNLSLFVISIQINQKQLKWSDNGRKKNVWTFVPHNISKWLLEMGCGDGARYNSICLIVHLVHQSPTCQMKLHSVWIQIRYNHGLKFSLKISPVTSFF